MDLLENERKEPLISDKAVYLERFYPRVEMIRKAGRSNLSGKNGDKILGMSGLKDGSKIAIAFFPSAFLFRRSLVYSKT